MSQVTVTSQPKGHQHKISTGKHSFIADAPAEISPDAAGMDPHELLLGALGACTSMTMQMFAARRGWEIKHISIKLSEESVDDPETPGKKLSRISRDIEIEGNLSREQLDTLTAIADKCPVHRILVGPKEIITSLTEAAPAIKS